MNDQSVCHNYFLPCSFLYSFFYEPIVSLMFQFNNIQIKLVILYRNVIIRLVFDFSRFPKEKLISMIFVMQVPVAWV